MLGASKACVILTPVATTSWFRGTSAQNFVRVLARVKISARFYFMINFSKIGGDLVFHPTSAGGGRGGGIGLGSRQHLPTRRAPSHDGLEAIISMYDQRTSCAHRDVLSHFFFLFRMFLFCFFLCQQSILGRVSSRRWK